MNGWGLLLGWQPGGNVGKSGEFLAI